MSRIKVESGRWAVNSMQHPVLKRYSYFPSQNENKAGRGKIKNRIQKRGKEGIFGGWGGVVGLQDTLNLNFIPFQDY